MRIFSLLLYTSFRSSKKRVTNLFQSSTFYYQPILNKNNSNNNSVTQNVFDDFLSDRNDTFLRGYDMRYPKDNNETEQLYKIGENMEKLSLLNKLNSSQLSMLAKITLIDSNSHIFDDELMAPNISKGGLLDDFNFIF